MDTLNSDRDVIERILSRIATEGYSHGQIRDLPVFDRDRDHYLLVTQGWDRDRRIHHILVHLQIVDAKIWIQYDGIEYGIAQELLDAGIPKDRIVLGFKSPELRKHTGFAVA